MADNEKNNTKIMKENFADKALDAEQLDGVAGGSREESYLDNRFLNYLLGDSVCEIIEPFKASNKQERDRKVMKLDRTLEEAWAKVGVTCVAYARVSICNIYEIDGKRVSRGDAMRHAQKVLGKYVKDSDWM